MILTHFGTKGSWGRSGKIYMIGVVFHSQPTHNGLPIDGALVGV